MKEKEKFFDVDKFLSENYTNRPYDSTPRKRQEATKPRKISVPLHIGKKYGIKYV